MPNVTYNVEEAFQRLENDLIQQLIDEIQANTTGDILENGDVISWKKKQLKARQQFKKRNSSRFSKNEKKILYKRIEDLLTASYIKGGRYSQKEIEEAIKKGLKTNKKPTSTISVEFISVNDRKLNALIKETAGTLYKAEHAALRYIDDVYRKIIFDTHIYFQTGSGTLAQAIDMATKDFLSVGINCIEYKNGARVNIQSYSEMALRTANKRAYMQGEAAMRDEYGMNLVIVTRRGDACPKCTKYIGRVYNDDVYGSGPINPKYPRLSSAIEGGLYHPNCRDTHTTYFEGITKVGPPPTAAEQAEIERVYELEQKQRYNERQIRKYKRLEAGAIDPENIERYGNLRKKWQRENREFVNAHEELRRKYYREKVIT